MMTVPIVDSIFTHTGAKSIGVSDEHPTYFQWKKVDGGPAIYTDFCMKDAIGQPGPKIGWLIEAPGFRQNHFDFVVEHEDEFDFILTSIKEYVVRNPYKFDYNKDISSLSFRGFFDVESFYNISRIFLRLSSLFHCRIYNTSFYNLHLSHDIIA